MTIFNVLTLLGGLALFLYGMNIMGDGLKKVSGGKLESILQRLTSSPFKGMLLGLGVTAIIQSSSATTVMVVGFVNSGIMALEQAVGVIMGANIGTTVTSWILSMTSIQGESFLIQLLEPAAFSPFLAFIGILLVMFSRNEKKSDVGTILLGFAVLMSGMMSMSGAVAPLADVPEFTRLMTMFSNPVLGLLAGTILTAIIQSSSASVGILQALCATGTVQYSVALPVIMGQNIGTCITAILSAVGANRNSKRTALMHLFFNLIGTTVFLVVFYTLNVFVDFAFLDQVANETGIAVIHSSFNIGATILLLPFSKMLVKLSCIALPVKDDEKKQQVGRVELLDVRFLEKPAFAVNQSKMASEGIFEEITEYASNVYQLVNRFDVSVYEALQGKNLEMDEEIDFLNDYLVQLSDCSMTTKDRHTISSLMQITGELKGSVVCLQQSAKAIKKLNKKNGAFSDDAKAELDAIGKEMLLFMQSTMEVVCRDVEPRANAWFEQARAVKKDIKRAKKNHKERMQGGMCNPDAAVTFLDILTSYKQLALYCTNLWEEAKER